MKLELKHLAPYLPYGLIVQSPVIVYTEGENPIPSHDGIQEGVLTVDDLKHIDYLRPILRPLSDLTKKIEHQGERFVPFDKIYDYWHPKLEQCIKMIVPQTGGLPLDLNNMLFEWHFDVFGLIPEGLAIEKV